MLPPSKAKQGKLIYLLYVSYGLIFLRPIFTQEAICAALIFAQTESHKIAIYQLVDESSRIVNATRWNARKAQ